MELIIKIPEEMYAQIIDENDIDTMLIPYKDIIKNGMPLTNILDKIRAEIKTKYDSIPWRNNDYDDGWIEALEWVFDDVLDKYKAESEGKK